MSVPPASDGPEITILVVDDHPLIGAAIKGMLARERGMTVHFCEDPRRALDTARRVAPSIILQDLVMPGMSGLQLIEEYRDDPATASVPIIVLSSQEDAGSKTQAFALGADDYLIKIPDKFQLIERIRHLVSPQEPGLEVEGAIDQVTVVEVRPAVYRRSSESSRAPTTGAPAIELHPSVPVQDLGGEGLLKGVGRGRFGDREVPVLRGIALLAKLGHGAMGAVYYGIHSRLRCEVAVKVLPPHLAEGRPYLVERFYLEAQIAARIESPNLVRVLDVDQDGGLFFLVMEFVSGLTAKQLAGRRAREEGSGVSEREAVEICLAASRGLAAAHHRDVIHRDIKPDNILIPRSGDGTELRLERAKLADLGIARLGDTDAGLTVAGATLGTPGFMAPEQVADARKVGKPADVFAMGATLYALLCDAAPFRGATSMEAAMATVHQPHEPVTAHRSDVSPVTSTAVERALAKEPERRFADGAALVAALTLCREMMGAPPEEQEAAAEHLATQ